MMRSERAKSRLRALHRLMIHVTVDHSGAPSQAVEYLDSSRFPREATHSYESQNGWGTREHRVTKGSMWLLLSVGLGDFGFR
jgi:hypothetical protein